MRKPAAFALLMALLVLPAPSGAEEEEEIAKCPMHHTHSGPHVRASCQMTFLGSTEISSDKGIGQIELRGSLAAVVEREGGRVAFVDVSDPTAPQILGRYDGNTGRPELDDPFDGDVAFSADGHSVFYARQTHDFSNDGLHVIDITNPAQPQRVEYVPGGGTLRVAAYQSPAAEYVVTLDAIAGLTVFRWEQTPLRRVLVPLYNDPEPLLEEVGGPASAGLFIDPRDPILGIPLLYVSTGGSGLRIFDFSAPDEPVLLGSWATQGLADIEVLATPAGRTIYAAPEYWFNANTQPRVIELDASNLSAISERQRFSPGEPDYPSGVNWRLQGLEVSEGRLYLAHSHAGVGVIDLCCVNDVPRGATTDLGEGNTAGEFKTISPYAMDVEVSGGVVYVSDASTGTLSAFRFEPKLIEPTP